MNGEQTVLNFIKNELGDWPILYDNFEITSTTPIDKLIALRLIGVKSLFELSVSSNPKQPNKFLLRVF